MTAITRATNDAKVMPMIAATVGPSSPARSGMTLPGDPGVVVALDELVREAGVGVPGGRVVPIPFLPPFQATGAQRVLHMGVAPNIKANVLS